MMLWNLSHSYLKPMFLLVEVAFLYIASYLAARMGIEHLHSFLGVVHWWNNAVQKEMVPAHYTMTKDNPES